MRSRTSFHVVVVFCRGRGYLTRARRGTLDGVGHRGAEAQVQQLPLQPAHLLQHGPASHPQAHVHLGSSQQHVSRHASARRRV